MSKIFFICEGSCQAERGSEGRFPDRREYVPVGFGRDVLSLTILETAFRPTLRVGVAGEGEVRS